MNTPELTQVDSDEWADFCSYYRSYASEPNSGILRIKHVDTKEVIGEVLYDAYGRRKYFINYEAKSPRIE